MRHRWRQFPGFSGALATWLGVILLISIGAVAWFGYHASSQWRQSSLQLAQRQSADAADLLLQAVVTDMRAIQRSFLRSPEWSRFDESRSYEMSASLATAFAEYPYPEAFFTWHHEAGTSTDVLFFTRAERPPSWSATDGANPIFPVVTQRNESMARLIATRVDHDARARRLLSAFNLEAGKTRYQVVAMLTYSDPFRNQVDRVTGMLVDLAWVRDQYFSELTRQVSEIARAEEAGLTFAISDGRGATVAGDVGSGEPSLSTRRDFELLYFDPDLLVETPEDLSREMWSVRVNASGNPALTQAITGASRTVILGAAAALTLAMGIVLAIRAEQKSARLTALRADFVSTVTHELKTPIATIRAAAETLAEARLSGTAAMQTYGHLVAGEAKRLSRLVENLLAYSRLTDVADVYKFEPLDVAELFADVTEDFEVQLDEAGFELTTHIAPGTPRITAARHALRLLFDNLVDNSIRYSTDTRQLSLSAAGRGDRVVIEVTDAGVGIPPEETATVIGRFVRGRNARPGGTGLGLAIAHRIATDHGGTLEIESVLNVGTTIRVTLPAAPESRLDHDS